MNKSQQAPDTPGERPEEFGPLVLLLGLLALGLVAHFLGWLEWRQVLQWTRGYTAHWWLAAALILLQIVLFMFAMPGSTLLWVVAVLYPPIAATLILVAGASMGGLAGYLFARRLARHRQARLRKKRHFRLLREHGDFFTLCALRVTPGFPHSIINYGAGILGLPLGRFLAAAVLGLGVKTALYSHVIHRTLEAAEPAERAWQEIALPLVLLALLLLLARLIFRRRAANTLDH